MIIDKERFFASDKNYNFEQQSNICFANNWRNNELIETSDPDSYDEVIQIDEIFADDRNENLNFDDELNDLLDFND